MSRKRIHISKALTALTLAVALLLAPVLPAASAVTFEDEGDIQNFGQAALLADLGIMVGDPGGNFNGAETLLPRRDLQGRLCRLT